MNTYRMPRKRVNPRRKRKLPEFLRPLIKSLFLDSRSYVTKGGRVRLFGVDYDLLRVAAYNRAKGRCECGCGGYAFWATASLPEFGTFAHNEHGARKSDELERGKWMRHECHMKSHNSNGKPCPPKEKVISAHAGTS